MKTWWTVGVDTQIGWPRKPMVIQYAGRAIHLLPGGEALLHDLMTAPTVGVAYDTPGYVHPQLEDAVGEPRCPNQGEAIRVIKRFLSVLSWSTDQGITEHGEAGGPLNSACEPSSNRYKYGSPDHIFEYYRDCLPVPADEEGRFALAFYREGLSVNNLPYQFLSFAKVLNLRLSGTDQIAWINSHLDHIVEPYARHRIDTLKAKGESIGVYLYTSGRCAVAHALGEPRVDPDDPDDLLRLHEDLPLIRALAARFITHELRVKTPHAISEER